MLPKWIIGLQFPWLMTTCPAAGRPHPPFQRIAQILPTGEAYHRILVCRHNEDIFINEFTKIPVVIIILTVIKKNREPKRLPVTHKSTSDLTILFALKILFRSTAFRLTPTSYEIAIQMYRICKCKPIDLLPPPNKFGGGFL